MTRDELLAALKAAESEGWRRVCNETPPAGERVDVMHILNRSYDTDGKYGDDGKWHCSNGFVLPDMTFTFRPTHWREREASQ